MKDEGVITLLAVLALAVGAWFLLRRAGVLPADADILAPGSWTPPPPQASRPGLSLGEGIVTGACVAAATYYTAGAGTLPAVPLCSYGAKYAVDGAEYAWDGAKWVGGKLGDAWNAIF